jgi:DNA-binding NtrC family response regulator
MKSVDYKSIALVDDDKDTVNLFTYFLRENGYDVIGFTDHLLLLDYILHNDNKFRLVIIDYRMPKITGCELANKIADINPRIKMVLITAVNDIIKNKLNIELIHKPLRMHKLLHTVATHMEEIIT